MTTLHLTSAEVQALRTQHRGTHAGRERDRIKAVLLKNDGWSSPKIAHALLLEKSTVNRYIEAYQRSSRLKPLQSSGRDSKLSFTQTQELLAHLSSTTYAHNHQIVAYIKQQYGVSYTVSGLHKWLHRQGFVYKQPKGLPYRADRQQQAAFIASYEALKSRVGADEPILFMDSVHPTQATKISRGWIKRGKDKAIATNGSRTRLNIMGAIELGALDKAVVNHFDCSINAEVVTRFLPQLRQQYPHAKTLHLIMDQAGYHKAKVVQTLAQELNITIHFLPPHSPNLNPIERLWKVMNKKARNNVFFKTPAEFRQRMDNFFRYTLPRIAQSLNKTINDNFQRLDFAS